MKIRTEFVYPPIPIRSFDWSAIDDDTYDGPGCPIGSGATEQEAIEDLQSQELPSEVLRSALEKFGANGEHWFQGGYRSGDGLRICSSQAIGGAWCTDSPAYKYLVEAAARGRFVSEWNDAAFGFDEIKQGFEAAIALAESRGE